MPTIHVNKSVAKILFPGKMFYVKKRYYIIHGDDGDKTYYEYNSINRDFGIKQSAQGNDPDYNLCVVENVREIFREGISTDTFNLDYRFIDSHNESDWLILLKSCCTRSLDNNDKFYYSDLLWFLDNKEWEENIFANVLINNSQIVNVITNTIFSIGKCLSYNKQKLLQRLFQRFNKTYNIYMPQEIFSLREYCYPGTSPEDLNIFDFIDGLFTNVPKPFVNYNIESPFVSLYKWLHFSNYELENYDILKELYPFLEEDSRLMIIRRYFESIKNGRCSLNTELIKQFRDNKYYYFIHYRYSINTPSEPISLTVELLADSILSLCDSNGTRFQDFAGILDFAMVHSDCTNPSIQFRMNKFLPTCTGGAVYNEVSFNGFVYYSTIYKITETKITSENLEKTVTEFLDKYLKRVTYPVCRYDGNRNLNETEAERCSKLFKNSLKCDGLEYHNYPDKWIVEDIEKVKIVNRLLKNKIAEDYKGVINLQDIDLEIIKVFIHNLPHKYIKINTDSFGVYCYSTASVLDRILIRTYTEIIGYRIYPRKDVAIGPEFDIFHFWQEHQSRLSVFGDDTQSARYEEAYKREKALLLKEESEEIYKRTLQSLINKFGDKFSNLSEIKLGNISEKEVYFEMEYDPVTFKKIMRQYYYKNYSPSTNENESTYDLFLYKYSTLNTYPILCAPTFALEHNAAIDIPFFWCRGKECFHNNLAVHKLENCKKWENYSLMHIAEILGYNLLQEVEAGYEPLPIVREFIAIANRVVRTFKQLKCRECGHLLFTVRNREGFNRHNYYCCLNRNCSQVTTPIYINSCFKCKKGMIDSRDSVKCPNGWYICPTCFSCCDNEIIERQIQRYVIENRVVPRRWAEMAGRGHEDSNLTFCPKCGTLLENGHDNHEAYWCPTCREIIGEEADMQ